MEWSNKTNYIKFVVELCNQEYSGNLELCLSNIEKHKEIVNGC